MKLYESHIRATAHVYGVILAPDYRSEDAYYLLAGPVTLEEANDWLKNYAANHPDVIFPDEDDFLALAESLDEKESMLREEWAAEHSEGL